MDSAKFRAAAVAARMPVGTGKGGSPLTGIPGVPVLPLAISLKLIWERRRGIFCGAAIRA